MYVDDSGSPNLREPTRYFVLSGIIIHELEVENLETKVQQYKERSFVGDYANAEVHVHDIFQRTNEFRDIPPEIQNKLLNRLYGLINYFPLTIISVAVDKHLIQAHYPHWDIFNAAWTFIVERFDTYISDNGESVNKGMLIVDKSGRTPQKQITSLVNYLRKYGSNYRKIMHLVEEPMFIDSDTREGIIINSMSLHFFK